MKSVKAQCNEDGEWNTFITQNLLFVGLKRTCLT